MKSGNTVHLVILPPRAFPSDNRTYYARSNFTTASVVSSLPTKNISIHIKKQLVLHLIPLCHFDSIGKYKA